MLMLLTLCGLLFHSSAYGADFHQVNNGTTVDINEHGVCREVTNNIGAAIFIPTKTSTEWASFYNSPPTNVSITPTTHSYGSYGSFGSCQCPAATRTRTRSCFQDDGCTTTSVSCSSCGGDCTDTQACTITHSYGSFGPFGACQCPAGIRTRTRSCFRNNGCSNTAVSCSFCGGSCTNTQACSCGGGSGGGGDEDN